MTAPATSRQTFWIMKSRTLSPLASGGSAAAVSVNSSAAAAARTGLKRKFKLDPDPECARVAVVRQPPQIGGVIFETACRLDAELAQADPPGERRADAVARLVAVRAEADDPVILVTGLHVRIESQPRLRGDKEVRRADTAHAELLGEERVERVQRIEAKERGLFFDERAKGERPRIA